MKKKITEKNANIGEPSLETLSEEQLRGFLKHLEQMKANTVQPQSASAEEIPELMETEASEEAVTAAKLPADIPSEPEIPVETAEAAETEIPEKADGFDNFGKFDETEESKHQTLTEKPSEIIPTGLILPDQQAFEEPEEDDNTYLEDTVVPDNSDSKGIDDDFLAMAAQSILEIDAVSTGNTELLNYDSMDNETDLIIDELIERRERQKKIILTAAAILGILLIIAVIIAISISRYKPKLNEDIPFNRQPSVADSILGDQEKSFDDAEDSGERPVISDDYTRRDDIYNFLILGVDYAANLSDVIMIASYDVKNQDIHVLQLPRDTYIDTGSNYHKLNAYFAASYNHSRERGEDRYRDAVLSMKEFLESGLCVKLDRYICMDTEGFRNIVDAIGGVDLEVPFAMNYEDPEQDLYIHLEAGFQHLDGNKAEQFVRFRKAYLNGDIGRISAQKLFLTALAKGIKENLTVSSAVSIAKTVLDYVITDLSVAECGYFAKYAFSVDLDKITYTTLPGAGAVNPESGASYYVLYADAVRKLINRQFNVYKTEISDTVFLSNSTKFVGHESYIAQVFNTKNTDTETLSADEVSRDSVDIPTR